MPPKKTASPFNKIPVEIICSIFHFLVSIPNNTVGKVHDPRSTQFAFLATCARWRKIAISMPTLWTTIHIVLPCPRRRVDILQRIHKWSANRPLSIYVVASKGYDPCEHHYYPAVNPEISLLLHKHLIPKAELLWLDSPCYATKWNELDEEVSWFPLRPPDNHHLRYLHIGRSAFGDEYEDCQLFSLDIVSLDTLHIRSNSSLTFPSLKNASPRNVLIETICELKQEGELDEETISELSQLPQLEQLSLISHLPYDWEPALSSASLRRLDILLSHTSFLSESEPYILSDLPSLESLTCWVGSCRDGHEYTDGEYESSRTPRPQLPCLHELIIKPSLPHFERDGFEYGLCECIGAFLPRANALIMLDVHHGHVVGALESLIASSGVCSSLECFQTTAVEHTELLRANDIVHMSSKLCSLRPSLQFKWVLPSPEDPFMFAVEAPGWSSEEDEDESEEDDDEDNDEDGEEDEDEDSNEGGHNEEDSDED
ncbi:hypothetical protein DL93DRAFT_2172700 [Clavulina sp. PMI_390]|nr:hypothetical protein DL93DRAFT_2172700 [Clavulina sp. PMI_390]